MKTSHLLLMGLATTAAASTAQDQSYLAIFAETHATRIAGTKVVKLPPLPPGVKLPPAALAMLPTAPKKLLSVRLWSPTLAPDGATASIVPPSGLGLGDKLDLDLFRPTPRTGGGAGGGGGNGGSGSPPDFTIKFYWGSSDSVQPGQPKVFNLATLTPAQQMEMGQAMIKAQAARGDNYYYKDNWTTGYWPAKGELGEVKEGSLVGTYNLNSSYAGNVSIDAPSDVDFLAPIEMTSPNLDNPVPLDGSIAFQWNPIANCLGSYATAMGPEGEHTLIVWSSSDQFVDQIMADTSYLQMAEVKDRVASHLFMPGDRTNMTIPGGIFKSCKAVIFNMIGYGPGAAREGVTPLPRIQTKTTLSITIPKK
ncbi:MAG TPA: hypothetical protein VG944_08465 [Fimbriimonas sp.]|nr:hypothetical protein [Fimbriimonas sp.]